MNIHIVSPQALRRAADLQERIQALQAELAQLLNGVTEAPTVQLRGRKRMSVQGLANIRAGVRKRWAAFKRAGRSTGARPTRRMSAAAKARLAAVARARWRKAKAAGRSAL